MKTMVEQESAVPVMKGAVDFNAQHSPMGAFMSFTCGHGGSAGGIGVEIGKPGNQGVYVGVKDEAGIRCLPFYKGAVGTAGAASYQVEQATGGTEAAGGAGKGAAGITAYGEGEIARRYGWGTDAWETADLTLTLATPFGPIPDPGTATPEALRAAVLPAIVGTLRIDNRGGAGVKTGFFAIDFVEAGARVLPATEAGGDVAVPARVGFAWRRKMGVMAEVRGGGGAGGLFPIQRWSVAEALSDVNAVHALGTLAGVAIEVPAGEVREITLAIGVHLDGIVTTGLDASYCYARHYAGLGDVLTAALDRAGELMGEARRLDAKLLGSGLSAAQQFLIAHATRSYYGSTQLLDVGGEPFWIVNEGEYCMMNTLDLSVDQMFWELEQNPWVVRNLLDNFVRRYSYVDQVRSRGGKMLEGGVSFAHDMGVNNNFSPAGHSSYELAHLTGCFSYMTAEQLCNWLLIAATYVSRTEDAAWARHNHHVIAAAGRSLVNRCAGTGVIQLDSSRCGKDGAEITTYDSLDHSLAQTRNNLYIAVKCWASFLAMGELAAADGGTREEWEAHAGGAAETVLREVGGDGVIPAVFERDNPGHASRILPACEGLIYPLMWKSGEALRAGGRHGKLVEALKRHTLALLMDGKKRNHFADGGIRLSSTSNNSWMSKIAIVQQVVTQVFHLDDDLAVRAMLGRADEAHMRWQTVGSAYWACCDQIVSGEAKGSRYYPRIITAALWLEKRPPTRRAGAGGKAGSEMVSGRNK